MKWPGEDCWVSFKVIGSAEGSHTSGYIYSIDGSVATILEPIIPADWESLPPPLRPPVQHSIHIINECIIESFDIIKCPSAYASIELPPAVKPIKTDRIQRKEQRAMQKRQMQFGSRAPKGTSEEAILLFTSLSKTYYIIYYIILIIT